MINVGTRDETNINQRQLEMGKKIDHSRSFVLRPLIQSLFFFGGAVYITFYQVIDHSIIFKCSLNSLSPKSDQCQISPCNITAL